MLFIPMLGGAQPLPALPLSITPHHASYAVWPLMLNHLSPAGLPGSSFIKSALSHPDSILRHNHNPMYPDNIGTGNYVVILSHQRHPSSSSHNPKNMDLVGSILPTVRIDETNQCQNVKDLCGFKPLPTRSVNNIGL